MKGAVIHDFENNLGKFGFKVNVIDSRVEGQQAVQPILAAVEAMRELANGGDDAIEALVIIRGGGSLESLQAFNNETLVRAIVDFPVPVIAGIVTTRTCRSCARRDYMTSTPTAAAHLLSRRGRRRTRRCASSRAVDWLPLEIQRSRNDLYRSWDGYVTRLTASSKRRGNGRARQPAYKAQRSGAPAGAGLLDCAAEW